MFFLYLDRVPKCAFGRNWPSRTLQTQKHRQIRRLCDPNPMKHVPDPDSAKNHGNKLKLYFAYSNNLGSFAWFLKLVTHICVCIVCAACLLHARQACQT